VDAETKSLIEAACLLDDLTVDDHQHRERQRTKQRGGDGRGLVFKTREDALIPKNDAEPTADVVSRDDVLAMLDDFADLIGEVIGERVELGAEIQTLRDQVGALRSEVETMKAIAKGTVTPMLRGNRDAA
jgi:hypothetical protein